MKPSHLSFSELRDILSNNDCLEHVEEELYLRGIDCVTIDDIVIPNGLSGVTAVVVNEGITLLPYDYKQDEYVPNFDKIRLYEPKNDEIEFLRRYMEEQLFATKIASIIEPNESHSINVPYEIFKKMKERIANLEVRLLNLGDKNYRN